MNQCGRVYKEMSLRKILFFLVLLLFLGRFGYTEDAEVLSRREDGLSLLYRTGKVTVVQEKGGYHHINATGCSDYIETGRPIMPVIIARILIPNNKTLDKIGVTASFNELQGIYRLATAQKPLRPGDTPGPKIFFTGEFPEKEYEILGIERKMGHNIAIVRLYPFRYNSASGRVDHTESITLNAEFSTAMKKLSEREIKARSFERDRRVIREFVDNDEELSTYAEEGKMYQPLEEPYDYVIITNSTLEPSFQTLANYIRDNRGLTVAIIDLEDIYTPGSLYHQTGRDNPEQIRNFIIWAYNNWHTQYVLLGGYAGIIPVRYFASPVGDYPDPIPSDVYYSNLDGSFDYNENDIFGEYSDGVDGGDVDTLADVFVGRVPAATEVEVANFTDKVISYTQTDNYRIKRAAFIGRQLDMLPTWGGDAKDAIKDCCVPYWDVKTFYERDKTYEKGDVIDYINDNDTGVQIVNVFTHGSTASCGGFSSSDVLALQNTNYFVAYSQGCQNAWFDWPEKFRSVGEYFVTAEHAAVAFIGNSRFGWYLPGYSLGGPSQIYDKEFFDVLFNENIVTLGDAFHIHKDNIGGSGYYRYVYYELVLFGDPSMPVSEERVTPTPLTEGYTYYVQDSDIWKYDLATGTKTQLTSFGTGDIKSPVVTDDGKKIIFSRDTGSGYNLFIINTDGSGLENLTDAYDLSDITEDQDSGALSPNREVLAFTATSSTDPSGGKQLWAKELTGQERLFQLTFDDWNCSYPIFVNDNYILFKTTNIYDTLEDYYLITYQGTNLTNITKNNSYSPWFPKLGRPLLNRNKTDIIYGKQTGYSDGTFSDWSIYKRPVWTGGERLVLTGLYYTQEPEDQPDPMPAFVNSGEFIFRGISYPSGEIYLYHTLLNSDSPYLSQLSDTLNTSYPFYFLPLPQPAQFVYIKGGQVYVRDNEGNDNQLTDTVNSNNDPVFDATGTYIAYSGNGIWVMKANGTGATQIEETFTARHPAFSPDSEWLIYVKDNDIYARRADKTLSAQRLTFTDTLAKSDLSFSPDGTKMLYTLTSGGTSQIYCQSVTISDSYIMLNGDPAALTGIPGNNYHSGWSSDGGKIIYISTSAGEPAIFTMNPDGSDKQQLTIAPDPVNPGFPSFSPYGDGEIAYISNGNVWIADTEEETGEMVSPTLNATKKFGWASYPTDRLESIRQFILKQIDPSAYFTYNIFVTTNALNPATSIVLTEIIPTTEAGADWELETAYWNGEVTMPNESPKGTLKWVLGLTPPLGEEFNGGVMKIVLSAAGDGPVGSVRSLNGSVYDGENYYSTSGDTYITIGDPFIPADTDEDWVISDDELIIAIDYWAANSRIGGWPEYTGDWDFYLLQIIDFWVNDIYEYVSGESRWRIP
jgi:Tol biopolymer transport system component